MKVMMTTQAQMLKEDLERIGLKHGGYRRNGDFRVTTEGNGRTGFGNALAIMSNDVMAKVLLIADRLQDAALTLVRLDNDRMFLSVSSDYRDGRYILVIDYKEADGTSPKTDRVYL
jgi:hypothetical protein